MANWIGLFRDNFVLGEDDGSRKHGRIPRQNFFP